MTTALEGRARMLAQANPAADPQYLAARMWDTWQAPHRQWVTRAVEALAPTSLYELGCGAGPNLRLIQHHFPSVVLQGSEPFPPYAAWAQAHLTGVPVDVHRVQSALPIGYDVVLSCYVLAYVVPDEVRQALTRLRENRNPRLLLLEPMDMESRVYGVHRFHAGDTAPDVSIWAHGWDRLLAETGWVVSWAWPIMPVRDGLNAVIVARAV